MNPLYSYSAGLNSTWIVLVMIFGIFLLTYIARITWTARQLHRLGLKIFSIFGVIVLPILATVAFFPLVYCTLNILEQPVHSVIFWKSELASGTFALRISSYVLSFQLLRSLFRFIKGTKSLARTRAQRGIKQDEIANFTVDLTPYEANLWLSRDLALVSSAQFTYYLSTLAALWLCVIDGQTSLAVTIASWCLFFVIDDWSIISDYTDKYKNLPINSHAYKIQTFNLALLILTPMALLGTSYFKVALGLLLTMILALAITFLIPLRTKTLNVQR